jgi:hypothetical protein
MRPATIRPRETLVGTSTGTERVQQVPTGEESSDAAGGGGVIIAQISDCAATDDPVDLAQVKSLPFDFFRVLAMKRIGLLFGFAMVFSLCLAAINAQDAKKDGEKDKKDVEKKDEKKDPDKKDEKKDDKKKEKFVYGWKVVGKIVNAKPDTNREYTVEVQEIDKKKVAAIEFWAAQRQGDFAKRQVSLSQALAQANTQKDVNARAQALLNYKRDLANYQADLTKFQFELTKKRASEVYTPKNMDVRGIDTAKVRSMTPPVEFDDAGNLKKLSKKELEERKDKSGLPGYYPSEWDHVRPGAFVEIYFVKPAPMKKEPPKKKAPDDEPPMTMAAQEFLLVVIIGEGKQ